MLRFWGMTSTTMACTLTITRLKLLKNGLRHAIEPMYNDLLVLHSSFDSLYIALVLLPYP